MERKAKAIRKDEMAELYITHNAIAPSNQALGRFARTMGYIKRRIMRNGVTETWYVRNLS